MQVVQGSGPYFHVAVERVEHEVQGLFKIVLIKL